MIDWFKSFFQANTTAAAPVESQVRIAAMALMYEVARADGKDAPEETQALMAKLARRWQLKQTEAETLLTSAKQQAEEAVDYHKMATLLREHYDADQRAALVIDMWGVALADGEIDPIEELVIRKIADLLYVPHSTFIYGKVHGTSD